MIPTAQRTVPTDRPTEVNALARASRPPVWNSQPKAPTRRPMNRPKAMKSPGVAVEMLAEAITSTGWPGGRFIPAPPDEPPQDPRDPGNLTAPAHEESVHATSVDRTGCGKGDILGENTAG